MNKKPFSMHLDVDAFLPATDEEKAYASKMRAPSTFFRDGVKRLLKNKVATASFIMIVFLSLCCVFVPMLWPYSYAEQLGNELYGVDASYNNLSPFEYGDTEKVTMHGNVTAQEIFIPAPMKPTTNTDAVLQNTAKTRAEQILNEYLAGDRSEASFAALKSYATEEGSLSFLQISYRSFDAVDDKSFVGRFYGATDSSQKSKNVSSVINWLWKTGTFGGSSRTAGDAAVVASEYGYHVLYFSEYSGETESVFPHLFGTDSLGRDYAIRVVYGMRVSLLVGLFASIIVLVIGMVVGSIAGYCGGKIDLVIMRIVDIIYSLPDMLMVILLASMLKLVLGKAIDGTILASLGTNMISLFVVFALLYWVSMSRLIRGQILSLREQEYVLAARATGAKSGWIIRKHLVPNCISVIIISTALQIPSAIFTESYLSFLGLGVNAPMPSLGSLASDALNGINSYPHRLIIPAVVISLIVLSLNLFGDGLRDAFDPKLNK